MRKFGICLLVLLSLAVSLLTACADETAIPVEETVTTTTQPTMAMIVDEELDTMLTTQEISDAVGLPMGEPVVSGQGSMLTCLGVDNKAYLGIKLSEKPIEIFNEVLTMYADALPCPNLGESAWYSPVYSQLLVYGNGYMIQVELTGTEDGDLNMQMLRCRQIAALLLEHL